MDWMMHVFQNIEMLPVLLVNYLFEPRAKVVPRTHNIFAHFPKDRNCDILFEDENNEGLLQKTHRYCRAQSAIFY